MDYKLENSFLCLSQSGSQVRMINNFIFDIKSSVHKLVDIRNHARELRKNQTEAEEILWKNLRNRKLAGYKFLRQHPIVYKEEGARYRYFIADFYCHSKNVVIELDGPIHDRTIEYDDFRDSEMKFRNISVLRLKNEELENIDSALKKIKSFLDSVSME